MSKNANIAHTNPANHFQLLAQDSLGYLLLVIQHLCSTPGNADRFKNPTMERRYVGRKGEAGGRGKGGWGKREAEMEGWSDVCKS
jgi:hypothetical protein